MLQNYKINFIMQYYLMKNFRENRNVYGEIY